MDMEKNINYFKSKKGFESRTVDKNDLFEDETEIFYDFKNKKVAKEYLIRELGRYTGGNALTSNHYSALRKLLK